MWLPRLATDRLRRKSRDAPDRVAGTAPLVTTRAAGGRLLVAALDGAAEQAGLALGMTLADARAVAPELHAVPADPAADAALLDRLVSWCGRYTPWVAAAGLDGIFLDASGCAHLFGVPPSLGEAAMCGDLVRRLEGFGFAASAAMADTPGAAWAMAHYGADNRAVIAPGRTAAALAGLPVAALRLDAATASTLARVGIRRVAQLYAMPRAPLTARFGAGVGRRLDQASGALHEAISPRMPVTPFHARLAFAEPIALADDIERGLGRLLKDLCHRLDRAGRGARQLVLILYRVDGEIVERRVGAARPARDPAHLARLFAGRLGGFDPGFGVEAMTLAAPVSEMLTPAAGMALIPDDFAPARFCAEDLAPLIDRLGNRIGFEKVVRLGAHPSHLPERAVRARPALAEAMDFVWPLTPRRPLRLLAPPEPIETAPPGDPGGPPERFRWRRADHRIHAAEGPERIAPEWWLRAGRTRDYWRVEDTKGGCFWIYRHGLAHCGRPPHRPPQWYLHGLFG